jgi:hypothetical protein
LTSFSTILPQFQGKAKPKNKTVQKKSGKNFLDTDAGTATIGMEFA